MPVKKRRKSARRKRKAVARKSKGSVGKSKKRIVGKKRSKKTVKRKAKKRRAVAKKTKKRVVKKASKRKARMGACLKPVKVELIESSSESEMETESSSSSSVGTQTVPSSAPTVMLTDTTMASDDRFEKYKPTLMLLDGVPPQMTQEGTIEENLYQPQLALTDKVRPMKLSDAYRPRHEYPSVTSRERPHPFRPSRAHDYPSVRSREKLAKSPSPEPRGRGFAAYPSINRATSKEKVRAVSPPKKYTVFKATERWKEVKAGMAVPKGLEYKYDKNTGKNYARFPKPPKPVKEKKVPIPKPKPKSRSPSAPPTRPRANPKPKPKAKSRSRSPPKPKQYSIFQATFEFQEVLLGHACPPGLEYKMDMATGRSYARKMRK